METAPEETDSESPRLVVPVNPDRDHIQGPLTALLTLVEYGDYQCPYCGAAYPEVKKVQRELGSRLRFVFRNFPLTRIHEYALNAAETAEAAAASCGGYGLGVGVVTGGGIGAAAGFLRFMSIAIAIMTITAMIAPIMP